MDIRVEEKYLAHAKELHRKHMVVDAHLDLAGEILLRHQLGEQQVLKTRYLSAFQEAGVKLVASSVYVANCDLENSWGNAISQIEAIKAEIEPLSEVRLITSRRELRQLQADNEQEYVLGILLYMEGLDAIGEDLDKIGELYQMGVRGASLTWSRKNALATGCCKASEYRQIAGGLTEKGKEAIPYLENMSMFLDISHLNDDGAYDVCRIAKRPFVATHSNSKEIYSNYRNLTDEQLRMLAAQGGIAGLNGCQYIAGSRSGNHLEMLCRHVEHEVEVMGAAHIGFGFDLCDSYDEARAELQGKVITQKDDCLYSHREIPLVTALLLQRGMSEESVIAIIGQNWADYFAKVLPEK